MSDNGAGMSQNKKAAYNAGQAVIRFDLERLFAAANGGDKLAVEKVHAIEKILHPERYKLTVPEQRGMLIRFYAELVICQAVGDAEREYAASREFDKARAAIQEIVDYWRTQQTPHRDIYEYVLEHWKPGSAIIDIYERIKAKSRRLAVSFFFAQCARADLQFDKKELQRNLRLAEKLPLQPIGAEEWRKRKRGWSRS